MFDGIHHQDQLFHHFISSSSSSSPSSNSSSIPLSSLHHRQQISASSPFPNFDSSYSTPTPASSSTQHHQQQQQQSIQFHDLFQRTNLQSFPTPSPPQSHHFIPKYKDQQHSNSNHEFSTARNISHNRDEGLIRSVLPPPAASPTDLDEMGRSSWSDDEVVALLRIRSCLDTSWFPPEFTWEHVSRKLAEIGIKRSAEKCKDKFEEESRTYFNINTTFNDKISDNNSSSYKGFNELEHLYHHGATSENVVETAGQQNPVNNDAHDMEVEEAVGCQKSQTQIEIPAEIEEDTNYTSHIQPQQEPLQLEPMTALDQTELFMKSQASKKRTKKQSNQQKYEMMKEYCEGFVNRMMTRQEDIQNKILQDLLKKDEESFAREEAWRRMEMERSNKEIEVRIQEQGIAGDRQAAIIEFLNKFSTASTSSQNEIIIDHNIVQQLLKVLPNSTSVSNVSLEPMVEYDQMLFTTQKVIDNNQTSPCPNLPTSLHEITIEPQTPTSAIERTIITKVDPTPHSTVEIIPSKSNPSPDNRPAMSDDYGKRWPRDEVLALINLRCSFLTNSNNNNNGDEERETHGTKTPLWERISLKMAELGYKRSAKRCKEKWENINKYFRKTKGNANRKRSLDSRTCPYFHQLSHLYKQGTLVAPAGGPENCLLAVSQGEGANENDTGGAIGQGQ